jgi:hypothetical protein
MMVARSLQDWLTKLNIPDEQIIEGLARAIYMTHRKESSPIWEAASENARDFVCAQARNGLAHLRSYTRPIS